MTTSNLNGQNLSDAVNGKDTCFCATCFAENLLQSGFSFENLTFEELKTEYEFLAALKEYGANEVWSHFDNAGVSLLASSTLAYLLFQGLNSCACCGEVVWEDAPTDDDVAEVLLNVVEGSTLELVELDDVLVLTWQTAEGKEPFFLYVYADEETETLRLGSVEVLYRAALAHGEKKSTRGKGFGA